MIDTLLKFAETRRPKGSQGIDLFITDLNLPIRLLKTTCVRCRLRPPPSNLLPRKYEYIFSQQSCFSTGTNHDK